MSLTISSICKFAVLALVAGHTITGLTLSSTDKRQVVPITLGSAETFGVLAAATVTNTGLTVITGNLGVCPGSSVTGFPPGVHTGFISLDLPPACTARADCQSAYNASTHLAHTVALSSPDLAGLNLSPGVFTFPTAAATNSGNVTLNGTTNHNGQWIFQIGTTFTTASYSQVILTGGALASNVFFVLGSSATIGASSIINGNILASTSITLGGGAVIHGTVCAITAAVTCVDNAITAQ